VVRLATDEEISLLEDKRLEEDALLKICRLKVKQRGLNMNVVDAEYQFDRHKLIFFFEAEGRVDFRELVRDLFSIYKTRIWMQQLDKGGSGVNSVGICTAVGDDLEDDLFTGVDQQDIKSSAVSSPNE
jgi:cell fate regulator YaaT (PSP1 superfamily)